MIHMYIQIIIKCAIFTPNFFPIALLNFIFLLLHLISFYIPSRPLIAGIGGDRRGEARPGATFKGAVGCNFWSCLVAFIIPSVN